MRVAPGETNQLQIDYRNWAIPLQGRGLYGGGTRITIAPCVTDGAKNTNTLNAAAALKNGDSIELNIGGAKNSDLTKFWYLEDEDLNYGKITSFNEATGAITYTATSASVGTDRIFVRAEDKSGNLYQGEITIAVNSAEDAPLPEPQPEISIPNNSIKVSGRNYTLTIPVSASVNAVPGDIYRLTIKQAALDCDCSKYWHTMCVDITIADC